MLPVRWCWRRSAGCSPGTELEDVLFGGITIEPVHAEIGQVAAVKQVRQ